MRVVVALGGNALLRRGEPLTAENQRANVARRVQGARAARARARARDLARQRAAGRPARPAGLRVQGGRAVPARPARRPDRGHDRLPDPAGARQPAAVREAPRLAADADRGRPRRPRVREPDEADRPDLHRRRSRPGSRRRRAGSFKPDGDSFRRVVPSPLPQADLRDRARRVAARARLRRDLRRRRRHPGHVHRRAGPRRAGARRRRGRDRQGPRERAARAATCTPTRS